MDIGKIEISRLNNLFNSGRKCTKNETFKKNIEYCKKFIPIYNSIANRIISETSIKSLRAIYRALFVNKVTYKGKSTYTVSKDIIKLYEEIKEYNNINIGNPDNKEEVYKSILNNMHRVNPNFQNQLFVLGNAISNEILLEEINGYDTIKHKFKFMQVFNKLALLIFYRDCPGMNAEREEFIKSLYKTRYSFDVVMKLIMKIKN